MDDPLLDRLSDLGAPVVLVPVRHHSPAAADAVRELVLGLRPAAVLVEGPSDFNSRIGELDLPHKLPIAIYCHARARDGTRRGAYYPFCEYSPEWQALMAAREIGASRRFIDLPYHLADDERQNRYSDAPLRQSPYVERLCARLGVDDFDAAWDDLFEIDRLPAATYVRRAHALCRALREADGEVAPRDLRREEFMAAEIRRAAAAANGTLLVVTGGYHSAGIRRLLDEPAREAPGEPEAEPPGNEADPAREAGIALTPYSFERLDRLTGYDAGMPGPGFYQRAYQDRRTRAPFDFGRVIRDVAAALRKRKQAISAADLVGVETMARALAALRGHAGVFRRDLVDGFTAAVLKDELAHGGSHPLIDAIDEVLRGDARGELGAGTSRPPLVVDLLSRLEALGLELPVGAAREVPLELETAADRERSAFLHQLRLLGIRGVERVAGTDLVKRDDLVRVWERWRLVWSPDFDATAIEAARYGASLEEAAGNVLVERLREVERDAERGALALVDAALADLGPQARALVKRIPELVRLDGDLLRVVGALRHILFLYRYDRVLGASGSLPDLAPLVAEAWRRGLWLLEGLGAAPNRIDAVLGGVALLVECTEACPDLLPREELLEVLRRAAVDASQSAAVRGAATGAVWTLGAAAEAELLAGVNAFANPSRLGDYLVGLFSLAREAAQRQPELLRAVDRLLLAYDDDEFLEAVPSLRLAFTWFTPREKHHLSLTLLALDGASAAEAPPAPLAVTAATAERALAFEARLVELLRRHGLRGGSA